MFQSARLFVVLSVLVTLILIMHVAVFPSTYQEPPDQKSTAETTKTLKKKKKKKSVAIVPYVVFNPGTGMTAPVTVQSAEVQSSAPVSRNQLSAERSPGVHVSPTGITPSGPSPSPLVISEFRV